MRNKWLVFIICWLPVIAAEKNRDWQTGQIVESSVDQTARGTAVNPSDPQVHTIASRDRNYVVRGSLGNSEQPLAVGASVRFAVEGKTMFTSLTGKEYRLYVLGERVAAPGDPTLAHPSVAAEKPPVTAGEPLDNDAVVKMIVGGLKEDTVIGVIQARPGKYALGQDAVFALRAAGVPQSVIAAMNARMKTQR